MATNSRTQYFVHSYPSLVGGIVAAGFSIALLCSDGFANGFTLKHAAMPVLVGLTVLFAHEAFRACKEWKAISCVAFLALALFGSGVIISETMGRTAESRDATVSEKTKDVNAYAALLANLDRANKLVSEAESWVANECKTGVGPKCRGVTFTRDQRLAFAEDGSFRRFRHEVFHGVAEGCRGPQGAGAGRQQGGSGCRSGGPVRLR